MCSVSLAGKKSRRWLAGVVEKDRADDGVCGLEGDDDRRRPRTDDEEEAW